MKRLVQRTARRLGFEIIPRFSYLATSIHFLHLGKCAGTQVKHLANTVNRVEGPFTIVGHGHGTTLADLPREARYFFSIRDPVSRFMSGFYSRKRKGQPRIYSPWSEHDSLAFRRFAHANDLAEALFEDSVRGRHATAAMKSLIHSSMNQIDWFSTRGAFLDVEPPIWILRQDRFAEDLDIFLDRAGLAHLADQLDLTTDPVRSHVNDYTNVPALSSRAKGNLRAWYAQDVAFYDMCSNWLDEQL